MGHSIAEIINKIKKVWCKTNNHPNSNLFLHFLFTRFSNKSFPPPIIPNFRESIATFNKNGVYSMGSQLEHHLIPSILALQMYVLIMGLDTPIQCTIYLITYYLLWVCGLSKNFLPHWHRQYICANTQPSLLLLDHNSK